MLAAASVVRLPRYAAAFQFCLCDSLKNGPHVTQEIVSATDTVYPAFFFFKLFFF